jgi:hypothetical protein
MHSFQPLAADLAPLLKKSGDSGDKSKSRRPGNDLDVTRAGPRSPIVTISDTSSEAADETAGIKFGKGSQKDRGRK